jgi:hypothetical protein
MRKIAILLCFALPAIAGASRWARQDQLSIGSLRVLTAKPTQWQRVELKADVAGTFTTPFDPDEIRVDAQVIPPSGRTYIVPAFYYQRFERQVRGGRDHTTTEVMVAPDAPEWRVRIMPGESGEYAVRITAVDKTGTQTSRQPTRFKVAAAEGHGYIRVSGKDPHYFEFDDGQPYFAIGENLVEGPLSEYYRWIPRLAKNGGNYSRLWIGHPYFALELGPVGEYRLDNAWRLDQVMELSEEHGIFQKMCIDWIRHITPRGEPRKQFDLEDYSYSISNGGPCRNMRDFFTSPEARRLFRNRLRYTVGRWGYSRHVMAWELWNEINAVDREVASDRPLILDWNKEMCSYLKSVDPAKHLTTNSLGSSGFWPEMWEMPENEFSQMHNYYGWHRPEDEELAHDMAGFALKWLEPVSKFPKPYLFAEFGIIREKPDFRALCDRDTEGVHLHNGLWAPLAHGAAGTGALWWWGQYVDPKNLYSHFLPVAKFTSDVPWTTQGFRRAAVQADHPRVRVLGLQGKSMSLFWVQNKDHTWGNVVSSKPIAPIEGAHLNIHDLPQGHYRAEFWNTWTGVVSQETDVRSTRNGTDVEIPRLERDLALKLIRLN